MIKTILKILGIVPQPKTKAEIEAAERRYDLLVARRELREQRDRTKLN